jgi:hypothetical protein
MYEEEMISKKKGIYMTYLNNSIMIRQYANDKILGTHILRKKECKKLIKFYNKATEKYPSFKVIKDGVGNISCIFYRTWAGSFYIFDVHNKIEMSSVDMDKLYLKIGDWGWGEA